VAVVVCRTISVAPRWPHSVRALHRSMLLDVSAPQRMTYGARAMAVGREMRSQKAPRQQIQHQC